VTESQVKAERFSTASQMNDSEALLRAWVTDG